MATITTKDQTISINIEHIYLIANDKKIEIQNRQISFKDINDIYGDEFTNTFTLHKYDSLYIENLKKVRKDKINLQNEHAFYVSVGKDKYMGYNTYDLYLTKNEIELIGVEEEQEENTWGQIHINNVYKFRPTQNFKYYYKRYCSRPVKTNEEIEPDWEDVNKISDVLEHAKKHTTFFRKEMWASHIETLEKYLSQGYTYFAHYYEQILLINEFSISILERIEYSKEYKRREKIAKEINAITGTHLSFYDIQKLEKNGYKIVKTRK